MFSSIALLPYHSLPPLLWEVLRKWVQMWTDVMLMSQVGAQVLLWPLIFVWLYMCDVEVLSLRPATQWVPGQTELQSVIQSLKPSNENRDSMDSISILSMCGVRLAWKVFMNLYP